MRFCRCVHFRLESYSKKKPQKAMFKSCKNDCVHTSAAVTVAQNLPASLVRA